MTEPSWLPPLLLLSKFGGNVVAYLETVYDCFENDFVVSKPALYGLPVIIRIDPKEDNKEYSYWHVTHEGKVEQERIFAPRRCERIAWIRAIIENINDPAVKIWNYKEGKGNIRTYIWLENYDYVVVLEKSRNQRTYFLVTAFYIDGNSTQRSLQRKYEQREP
jgi:hypothetical protein